MDELQEENEVESYFKDHVFDFPNSVPSTPAQMQRYDYFRKLSVERCHWFEK